MESLWENTVTLPRFKRLTESKHTDVLIIGGGITGILTAYYLNRCGVECILVEKDRICGENTKNTTAKITYQHGLIYHKIAQRNGIDWAAGYYKANKAAFDALSQLCRQVECDYEEKDNYVYSMQNSAVLEQEMRVLAQIGCEATLCEPLSLPFQTAGAVMVPDQAQFHPLKLISAVCDGLHIYENTRVHEMKGKTAITDSAAIKAEKVVVATHFPFINKHGLYPLKLYQHRSYVIALEKATDVNGMYVDESDTGLSFRNYNGFLLLGGGGHRTGKQGGCWQELRRFAANYYPAAHEAFRWAAQDCMSLDGMPYIGRYSPSTPDLYVASGFNKWGMTGAMTAAMLISDMLRNKQNEYTEIFNPSRNMFQPQLFVNGFESVKSYITITPKRCPHLGCALAWNKEEHSWDCPCHGSRFAEDGAVINNPSNKNLSL